MIERGDRVRFACEARAESVVRDLDCDAAAQPCVDRAKHGSHPSFPEFSLDAIGSETCAGRHFWRLRLSRELRADLPEGCVEQHSLGLPGQQRFDFAAQLRIGAGQEGGSLDGGCLLDSMEQPLDLTKAFRCHTRRPGDGAISRASQTLAKSQSRRTVRADTSSTFAISSSVKPPKYRSSTTLAWRSPICASLVSASSSAMMAGSGSRGRTAVSSKFTWIAPLPRLCERLARAASTRM